MAIKGSASRYGAPAAVLHWATAAAVSALLPLGLFAARSSDPAVAAAVLRAHVPIGLLVIAATVGRLAWRLFDRRPDPVGGPRWRAALARTTHLVLYVVLLATGLSGIGLLATSGAGPILFGGGTAPLPRFAALAPMVPHILGAAALAVVAALHVGAALYHQFQLRDGIMSRMAVRLGRG